jgi:hypothetical protein
MADDWIKLRESLRGNPKMRKLKRLALPDNCLCGGLTRYFAADLSNVSDDVILDVLLARVCEVWHYVNTYSKVLNGDAYVTRICHEDMDDVTGVPGLSNAMELVGWVEYDEEANTLVYPAFEEHNQPASERKPMTSAERSAKARAKKKAEELLRAGRKGDGENTEGTKRDEEKRREDNTIEDKDQNTLSHSGKKAAPRKNAALRFEEWWTQYPKKTGKKVCLATWKRRHLDDIADTIINDTIARKTKCRKWREGFITLPSTYLNQDRWEDDYDTGEVPNGNPRRSKLEQHNEIARTVTFHDDDIPF